MRTMDQLKSGFDGMVYEERPGHIAVVAVAGEAAAFLELVDVNGRTLPFMDASGNLYGAIEIAITSTPQSLAWIAQQAGYTATTSKNAEDAVCAGFPNGAVGGYLLVDEDDGNDVAFNNAGTADGSEGVGSGIATGAAGPVAFGPRLLLAGQLLSFGRLLP